MFGGQGLPSISMQMLCVGGDALASRDEQPVNNTRFLEDYAVLDACERVY